RASRVETSLCLVLEPVVAGAKAYGDAADHEHPSGDLEQPRRAVLGSAMQENEPGSDGEDLEHAGDICKKLGHRDLPHGCGAAAWTSCGVSDANARKFSTNMSASRRACAS